MSECNHNRACKIPSYYNDTEWCPDCGAVRGNNGIFGKGFRQFKWAKPSQATTEELLYERE